MHEYPRHNKCLISGSTDIRPLKGYEKHYLVKSYPIGFVFAGRIPSKEELITHYDGYGRNDYYSPITKKRYQELLDQMEPFRKTNRLLDIGCGIGYFLDEAKLRGWEVYGTEYADKAINICSSKGIDMQQGQLNTEWYESESFDVITSFEVIEHIFDPLDEIKKIYTLLRKEGALYITTPNFNSLERFILKAEYNSIVYPEHLSYYTPRTLHYLLSKNGFSKKYLLTTGLSLSRIRASKTPSHTGADTRPVSATTTDEILRNKLESSRLLTNVKHMLNSLLTLAGVGNSLKAFYTKK
jgi:2-polyprenyl-3-methyl-5-hydroxy-6-metoxy-1,4-benzoquinol methylase